MNPHLNSRARVTSAVDSRIARSHVLLRSRSLRRGFTLLEILVVVTILLMATAVIIPFTDSTFAERRFQNSMDRVSGHLLSARLEAMERRLPVEVIWSNGLIGTRVFEIEAIDSIAVDEELNLETEQSGSNVSDVQEEYIEQLELPRGTECRDERPIDAEDRDPYESEESNDASNFRIAVFLPDGSVIERRPRWLVDDHGRVAALWIDRRTGLPSIQRQFDLDEQDTQESGDQDSFDSMTPADDEPTRVREPLQDSDS